MKKTALITGITGQDGAYLARLLLDKGYRVHGLLRRSSLPNTERLDKLFRANAVEWRSKISLHFGDMTDTSSIVQILRETEPDEIYNLAAMAHVRVSFDIPEYTAEVDALGTLRLLESLRQLNLASKTKFYQASTSELFGGITSEPLTETSPLYPKSPYAVAKLYAYWITIHYREAYNMFACNGILFNHESPLRSDTFVTRKITQAAWRIKKGLQNKLLLGNLDAKRDWGHAADYVEGMYLMLQHSTPDDYVLATGESYSVREFLEMVFAALDMNIRWEGHGIEEKGYINDGSEPTIEIDPQFFRPTEVEHLLGNAAKARRILGWQPRHSFRDLVKIMIDSEQIE